MSNTKRIMEQAQAFASAWSLVGGAFDGGDGEERERISEGQMTDKINTGGPAFPVPYSNENDGPTVMPSEGMSLRDYFAAKAMPACYAEYCAHANLQGYDEDWKMGVALDAYAMADAMIKARDVVAQAKPAEEINAQLLEAPVTAPVRLTDKQIAESHANEIMNCLQDPCDKSESVMPMPHDVNRFVRAIETAVLRANGFKIDHPEHAIELVGLRGCTGGAERGEDQPAEAGGGK